MGTFLTRPMVVMVATTVAVVMVVVRVVVVLLVTIVIFKFSSTGCWHVSPGLSRENWFTYCLAGS